MNKAEIDDTYNLYMSYMVLENGAEMTGLGGEQSLLGHRTN